MRRFCTGIGCHLARSGSHGTPGDQLGLRLERRKAPVEIVVVDHIEKTPTEN